MKQYRKKALLQLIPIVLAIILIYINLGAPYLSRAQADSATLTRNLAGNMEILQTIPVPDGSEVWSNEDRETIHLLRYEDEISAMVSGDFVSSNGNKTLPSFETRDGMAIVPLYGLEKVDFLFTKWVLAVVPTNPDIASIELTLYDEDGSCTTYPTEETYPGIFLATCDPIYSSLEFSIYDTIAPQSCIATGYDAQGNPIT